MSDLPTTFRRHPEQPIETDLCMCEGLFAKVAVFARGSYVPQHAHESDHLSVIAAGAVRVWEDGRCRGDFRAPAGIVIAANIKHTFLALEDHTAVVCVHRVADDGGPVVTAEHHLIGEDR